MQFLTRIVTPTFVAFNAHCWFAYAVVYTFYHPWVIGGAILAAALKEYWIDARYEVDQTFADNTQDFAGYLCGIGLAVLAHAMSPQ